MTIEVKHVIVERGSYLKPVVDETEDERMEMVACWRQLYQRSCWKYVEDCQ